MTRPRTPTKITPAVMLKFFKLYRETGLKRASARALGFDYRYIREHIFGNPTNPAKPPNLEYVTLMNEIDTETVEVTKSKLLERAHGYETIETRVEEEARLDPKSGKYKLGVAKVVRTKRHVPADPTCLIFELCNKAKDEYQHVAKIEVGGGVVVSHLNLTRFTTEQLEQALLGIARNREQLTSGGRS